MGFFTDRFEAQLAALGLKIVPVAADGNCFFRAIADQLEGDEEQHAKYREMVVQYIIDHRENFEPFVEDDENFDEYCSRMKESGTWAGNMEIQAASMVTRTNICIHIFSSPTVYIRNFDDRNARTLRLSYHNGEHYNSLTLVNDMDGQHSNRVSLVNNHGLLAFAKKFYNMLWGGW